MKVLRLVVLALTFGLTLGFAGMADVMSNTAAFLHHAPSHHSAVNHVAHNSNHLHIFAGTLKNNPASSLLATYMKTLKAHPLTTKMLTGGILATSGDAIAQSTNEDEEYDVPRAASFAIFDMAYRALQHASFPLIVTACQGQYAQGLLHTVGIHVGHTDYLAAIEQTLASQLGIVPFLYYPVFFTLTGFLQGLTQEQSLQRAQENFVPLMKRNLLFWIPVQFVQFGFVPTDLQIPFLSVCGLCWTFILSVAAGSTKGYSSDNSEEATNSDQCRAIHREQEELELANLSANLVLQQAEEKTALGELVSR